MILVKPHNSHERLFFSPCSNVENKSPKSEEFVEGEINCKCQDWNSNLGLFDSKFHIFLLPPHSAFLMVGRDACLLFPACHLSHGCI